MLSISNRTALCLTGIMLSGCMQSMPTAESLTRPTVEAFARLSSWTPWKPNAEEPPPVVIADLPPAEPPAQAPVAPPPEPSIRPKETRRTAEQPRRSPAPRLATARTTRLPIVPVSAPVAQEGASLIPAKMSCQTVNQPGERVRMECKPVE